PPTEGKTSSGAVINNTDVAKGLLRDVGAGMGIHLPNELAPWAREYIKAGGNPRDVRAWTIEFLEVSLALGADFVAQKRHYESLFMRALLVPERAATEGQSGTKAEAETQPSESSAPIGTKSVSRISTRRYPFAPPSKNGTNG
ncbi:unnamed protein product, partial [marine sediment metagenome]